MLRTRLGRIGIAGVAVLTIGLPATTASAVDDDIDYTLGEVTLVAGDATSEELGDGGPAVDALIQGPTGLARDDDGNLYIVSDAGRVRKVAADGTISTFAGGGEPAEGNGDGGPATDASLERPFDIVFDDDGNAYISDTEGYVRKVTPDGTISTFAGGGEVGLEGDIGDGGPATEAYLGTPSGLAWHEGELYIAGGFTGLIRKVDKTGTISTIAGSAELGVMVALSPLDEPLGLVYGIDVDAAGNVYIASTFFGDGGIVWKLDTSGDLTIVAGREVTEDDEFPAAFGDGGPATDAVLDAALGVAVHPSGALVIASGSSVRAVNPDGVISTIAGEPDAPGLVRLQGTELELNVAIGVHIDKDDTVIFSDAVNAQVWRLVMDDITDPVVKISIPESISRYDSPKVSVDCYDNRPGVECTGTTDGSTLDTSVQRPDPITVTATDAAGNVTTKTVDYTVDWEVTGTHAGSSGTEATIARLYAAYFGRLPEAGGFEFWEAELTADPEALIAASNFFSASTEFQNLYGSITNEEFVTLIYRNVMGRTPEQEGFDFWVLQLEQESFTRGEVMLFFSQSDEFKGLTATS